MNDVEINAILYYADFLSLKKTCTPVTDNCKYFFIYGVPINSAYLVNSSPDYDKENPYFIQAYNEYNAIKDKFGEDGVNSFIEDICSINACGSVDAERMLYHIHWCSNYRERKQAFKAYNQWLQNQKYTHIVFDEDGNPYEKECTRYVSHFEKSNAAQGVH